ncbi:MAG: sulfite exporter TauE/SafE family protein [Rhizobiales bacterium]|nr:sulfite exporter TauE/SafE family protein [Hyphomicrobiales bacterium]MBI3673818.1 sulfite exporter TauE/SafE family protein [Hyphomicrobiales bacterium]
MPAIEVIPHLAAAGLVFLAAIVRGYSGFGFSLLAITALSLLFAPAEIIPSIFMLEIAASLHLLPGLWREIHWRSLWPLVIGTTLGTPVGVYFLANVPAAPMQVALAVFVLTATSLLWRGYALKTMPSQTTTAGVGAAAGLANGAFGIGGPPVILFYFASPAGNVAGRASLVAYFLITDFIGVLFLAGQGLVTGPALIRTLIFLPALFAGVWLGARSFRSADPAVFRKWVLAILAVLALLTAAKGLLTIAQ